MSDLVGQRVLSWYDDDVVEYGGREDDDQFSSLAFALFAGKLPVRKCTPGRVAPEGTPIPAKDDRVQVVKHAKRPFPWAAGAWELALPGQKPDFFATKRDATTTGRRRLAILDWHTAQDTGDGEAAWKSQFCGRGNFSLPRFSPPLPTPTYPIFVKR